MKYLYKQTVLVIFIVVVVCGAIFSFTNNKKSKVIPKTNNTVEKVESISMCYYRGIKTDRGFYDVTWLKLNIKGENVTGELQNLPAEKDSKVGKFEGTVGPLDQNAMVRIADVWWDSLAEGMNVTEELLISFNDSSASMSFGGDAKDRGDGVYVYTDKSKITFQLPMDQVDCDSLDEKLIVEKYIRDNIKTIATNKPVLGGSWYVMSISVNPIAHTGGVVYEDGHIQSQANFIYTYEKGSQSVTVTNFKVKE